MLMVLIVKNPSFSRFLGFSCLLNDNVSSSYSLFSRYLLFPIVLAQPRRDVQWRVAGALL